MKPLLETIDTRFGTASKHAFSRGNTLPYTGVPFGMNYFVPQTSDQDGSWFFDPHLPIFQGIRLTHQPSPWIGDYSWLLLTPVTSQLGGDSLFHRQSSYDIDKACFQPHYLKLFSLRYQIETQLTPTCYGASIRLKQKQGKALSLYLHAADELTVEQVDKRTLALRQEGKTETNKNPLMLFTALQMNTDILAISQEAGDWRIDLASSQTEMQLATSFISPSQALLNLPQEDFDSCKSSAQADWENLLHRFDIIEIGINGRHGLAQYQELGYLSTDHHESVSHTLDYAYSDFCIASCAKKLENIEIAETYKAASQNYRQLFDAETGYMRARDNQGNFHPDFSPYSWGRDYAECSAIQATLGVLHDIPGLIQLMGGKETFSNYLLKACQDAPLFETTGYGYEIHEMSEMATAPFGQIAISNQPSFHIPYLFRYSDYPDYTALLIKTLRQKAFHPSWEAYPGDEDNGSLSAWYIWSALGFYPTCPGKPSYDLGIPLFDHLRVYLAKENKWLDIHTEQNHSHFNFVKECRLDKTLVSTIQHQDLLKAEQLTFTLSWLPNH
ncbi:TPA: glycoside hydrolase domain-containing protein [Streptococcus pneumoniae]